MRVEKMQGVRVHYMHTFIVLLPLLDPALYETFPCPSCFMLFNLYNKFYFLEDRSGVSGAIWCAFCAHLCVSVINSCNFLKCLWTLSRMR